MFRKNKGQSNQGQTNTGQPKKKLSKKVQRQIEQNRKVHDNTWSSCGCTCNACAVGTHERCYAGTWGGIYTFCPLSGK